MYDPEAPARVARAMAIKALKQEAPTVEDLALWIRDLLGTTVTLTTPPHNPRGAIAPYVDVTFRVERAHIETACCIGHALAPLFSGAFDQLASTTKQAGWFVPDRPGPHRAKATQH